MVVWDSVIEPDMLRVRMTTMWQMYIYLLLACAQVKQSVSVLSCKWCLWVHVCKLSD